MSFQTTISSLMKMTASFPNGYKTLVFTCLRYKYFENTAGKGEIAHKEQFLLFSQCFLLIWITFCQFLSNLKLSSAHTFCLKRSKICCLERVKDVFFFPQGSVLSAFFWGYTMTQFLGGYLSDRVGGDVVLPIAACCWSLITFWTPQLAYLSEDKYLALRFIILSRVFLGIFQGKLEIFMIYVSVMLLIWSMFLCISV